MHNLIRNNEDLHKQRAPFKNNQTIISRHLMTELCQTISTCIAAPRSPRNRATPKQLMKTLEFENNLPKRMDRVNIILEQLDIRDASTFTITRRQLQFNSNWRPTFNASSSASRRDCWLEDPAKPQI